MLTQRVPNSRVQPDQLKVAAHQFQTAVGSELFVTELDRKFALDRLPQPPYLQPHLWGLRGVPSCVTAALQMTCQRPLFFDQFVESTRINFGLRLRRPFCPFNPKVAPKRSPLAGNGQAQYAAQRGSIPRGLKWDFPSRRTTS